MNRTIGKSFGLLLLAAAAVLLGCVAYEPANLVTALHVESFASEATVVVAALAAVAVGSVSGIWLLLRSARGLADEHA